MCDINFVIKSLENGDKIDGRAFNEYIRTWSLDDKRRYKEFAEDTAYMNRYPHKLMLESEEFSKYLKKLKEESGKQSICMSGVFLEEL